MKKAEVIKLSEIADPSDLSGSDHSLLPQEAGT